MPKCAICKEKFTYRNNSFEKTCANKECMSEFALKFLAKKREADAKKIRTDWNKQKREKLDGLKTKTEYEKDLEKEINAIAGLLDKNQKCISCGGKTTPQSGHFYTKKAFPAIRFNLFNLWRQDYYCNVHLSSNRGGYELGLEQTFGYEVIQYIKYDLVRLYPRLNLTIEEIKQAIKISRSIVKELKSADKTYTTEERLELRRVYNAQIGLYHK